MAFRARIAQHIEIHRESRFPSLSPSAEDREPRALIRGTTPRSSSRLSHAGSQPPISTPLAPLLFYSRGTSAFASAATPFNLAPGPIPLCPYLIRLSLASDRFARTFLSSLPNPSRPLDRCACFCISRNTGIYERPHTGVSIILALVVIAPFRPLHLYPVACPGCDQFTRASTFLSPFLSLSCTETS